MTSHSKSSSQPTPRTYRIQGISPSCDARCLESQLSKILYEASSNYGNVSINSLAVEVSSEEQVATVEFNPVPLLLEGNGREDDQWTFPAPCDQHMQDRVVQKLTIDTHFLGLTPLHTAKTSSERASNVHVIAVSGLGSHAFGSFKEKESNYMWLRDALRTKVPSSNVWIYGFNSKVHKSRSFQTLDDLASGFESVLREVTETSETSTQLILIGHSLGGLIIKQALIRLSKQGKGALRVLQAVRGLLFFGVPNQGMAQRSLLAMSEGGPNEYLLHTLGLISEVLRTQREQFVDCSIAMDCEVYCFYETVLSPTAIKDDEGEWIIDGPEECLVTRDSATHYLEGKASNTNTLAISASHSGMVKFRRHDPAAGSIFRILANLSANIKPKDDLTQTLDKSTLKNPVYDLGSYLTFAPYLEESLFQGRTGELKLLEKSLLPQSGHDSQKIISLSGLGGMGKTQLALAFARKNHHHFTTVMWLNCKTEASVRSDIVRFVAGVLEKSQIVDSGSTEDQQKINVFQLWLSEPGNNRWLLILDNYDNPSISSASSITSGAYDIRQYFPQKAQGSILITTRNTELPYRAMPKLKQLDEQDSKNLLLQRAGREASMEDDDLEKLVKRLAGLPLALATAGDYLRQSPISAAAYLELYNDSWESLSNTNISDYEGRTLYNTWNITLRLIDDRTQELLGFLAYFDRQDIWFELLHKARDKSDVDESSKWSRFVKRVKMSSGSDLLGSLENMTTFHNDMRHLCSLSLVESHQSSESYSLHTCVYDWILGYLNRQVNKDLYRLAFKCFSKSYVQENTRNSWNINRRLYPHLQQLVEGPFKDFFRLNPGVIDSFDYSIAGNLYLEQSKLGEAQQMYARAFQGMEKTLGPDHISTLETVNNLGLIYSRQGKLVKAEQMYIRALQGHEKTLGQGHISTTDILSNLGSLYLDQGKLKEAEQLFTRALQGKVKALEPDHPAIFLTLDNLGIVYCNQGKLEMAEKVLKRALEGKEKTLGPGHKETLNTVNNLGNLYLDQGKLDEAEKALTRALQGKEKEIGRDHISTLHTVNNLGILYHNQDKLEEAELMYKRALQGYKKALGLDHIKTLNIGENLGLLYSNQGKLEEAEQMYTQALLGLEKALGPNHASTLRTGGNLEKVRSQMSRQLLAGEHLVRSASNSG